jgi:hypothetical protein
MMIIGWAYKQLSGKSTACYYLEKKYGFKEDSFAHSLKTGIGSHVFGLTHEQLHDQKAKATVDLFWNMTPREILQRAGTEAMRNTFDKDIWIKTLQKRLQSDPKKMYAISDVRYKNEAEAIKSWGGKVIRIDRDYMDKPSSNHISETELDGWNGFDDVVDNHSTFTSLYKQIDELVNKYVGKI